MISGRFAFVILITRSGQKKREEFIFKNRVTNVRRIGMNSAMYFNLSRFVRAITEQNRKLPAIRDHTVMTILYIPVLVKWCIISIVPFPFGQSLTMVLIASIFTIMFTCLAPKKRIMTKTRHQSGRGLVGCIW